MDRIRLLVASEDSSARRGLAAIFNTESIFEVLGAYSFSELIEKAICLQPDALLVDIPIDLSRYNAGIGKIKSECPCSLVIAIIDSEQGDSLVEMIGCGVDSCVPRGIMRGCLVKTVEVACRAGVFCLPGSLKRIVSCIKPEKPSSASIKRDLPASVYSLTRRENEILQLMARNFSNREIAGKLFISEPTVKTHVSSILRKLGQNNRAQAVVYSYKIGLVNEFMVAQK